MKIIARICLLGCLVGSAPAFTTSSGTRPLCSSEPVDIATPSVSPLPSPTPAVPSPESPTPAPTLAPTSTPTPSPSALTPAPTPSPTAPPSTVAPITPEPTTPATTAPAPSTPTPTPTPTPTTEAPGPSYAIGLLSGETQTNVQMLKNVCYSLSECAAVDMVNWGYYPGGNGIIVMMFTDDSCAHLAVSHPSEHGGGYQKFSDNVRVKSIGLASDFDEVYERIEPVVCTAPVPTIALPVP